MSLDSVLELIVDELIYLMAVGIDLKGPDGQPVHLRVQFLFSSGDYPGLHPVPGKLFKRQPAPYADYRSWHKGSRQGVYKMLYDPHLM